MDAVYSAAHTGGEGGQAAAGVESNPHGALSDEAAGSFDVFQDQAGDDAGLDEGGDAQAGEGAAGDPTTTDTTTNTPHEVQEGPGGHSDTAGGAGGELGAGEDLDALESQYREVLDAEEKKALGAHDAYDELGDKYEVDLPDGDDTHKDKGDGGGAAGDKDKEQAALMHDMLSSIDTSSMDDPNNYQHLYEGDYEALAAARDKALNRWWQDEEFKQASHTRDEQYVFVDPHVLTTPNVADIDGDGHDELVISVSYFYDAEYYDHPDHKHELGSALDITKYIACGVVVYDLRTRTLKWSQHLDLSTDSTKLKAYAYSSPTLADVNKDGRLEVVLGTSMGYLYVLDHMGKLLPGWPIQMGDVQGQPLVLDINNDGLPEVLAGDSRGNVAAFKVSGEEVWSRHVGSMVSQAATAGDVNGDGEIEVVFGTSSGHLYVVSGATGQDVKGFPFRAKGRFHAPPLITRLLDGPAQHIIVPSWDGYVYLVDGLTACADTLDIGETSYSMVLADDLDGNGRLDLVVTTMNGMVYAFETPAEYDPLKAWPSQVLGPNGMLARHDLVGIYATKATRKPRDVAGDKLQVQVRVVDKRGVVAANGSVLTGTGGPYNISAVLRGVGVKEMAAGASPVIGVADTVHAPGLYTLEVPCPRSRSSATIHIEMSDASGLTLSDEFALSFHMHFHKLLKWLIAGPLAAMLLGLLAVSRSRGEEEQEEAGLRLPLASPGSDLHRQ